MAVDVKWLRLLLTTVAVSVKGRLDVNVALNRPSYQVSDYTDSGGITFYAKYANDGIHVAHCYVAKCAHTNLTTNPWWTVDLGVPLHVWGIMFTNRGDVYADRSDNFVVGLTNVSPLVTAPTLWNYTVCGQYPGAVGAGDTVPLKCACGLPAYRYLIIQFPTTGYANVVEVEVYVSRWYWASRRGQKMVNKVASTIQVDRRLQCMINCTLSPICDSYNYRPSDKTCQLNTHDTPLNANSTDIVYDTAWTWWSPNFCTVV